VYNGTKNSNDGGRLEQEGDGFVVKRYGVWIEDYTGDSASVAHSVDKQKKKKKTLESIRAQLQLVNNKNKIIIQFRLLNPQYLFF
jgi:hypothetical protein